MKAFLDKIKGFFLQAQKISIGSKNKIMFLEQLSNLLNSGIPMINSLKIMKYQSRDWKKKFMLQTMINDLNKGRSVVESFAKFRKVFNFFDLSLIEMGEVTGNLGESVETIFKKEEKAKELKGKIIGALIYPIVIICLSIAMIGVFMVYVIPKIQKMYKDANVNLPELTTFVIKISEFIQHNIAYILLGILAFVLCIYTFKTWKKTKIYWDNFTLRIPIFGILIKKRILATFTSSLGILLNSGVIINKSLAISSRALENDYYEKKLKDIGARVATGVELSSLMGINEIQSGKENFLFPIELASVVKIGEETGKLPHLLTKISKKMNKEIDNVVKNIQTAIEPLVIVIVGGIIGVLIMAIMLPFFNMVKVI